ncbi:hypothetical protein L9G15_06375 [Shewanella sp. A3A]|uniref:Transmembrane protein n=1 Tax=Shewanella electrica TaxID=515560 RepID=A0ABT2FGL0_9GAMM|nr:hypothetical protein [Shewanella electrica]MCH1919059.1 hypothetical protein [Shewanella ferrihydritica]MCH1923358.1 hypothetical protein [Shewanella electrica]MCS4555455.1 hypothetical protein [Shewanella electrica]
MAHWLINGCKKCLLAVGATGVVIIYGGFFYLLLSGRSTAPIHWFYLVSPWLCIYFGLPHQQQHDVIDWLLKKFKFNK